MKQNTLLVTCLTLIVTLSSCELVKGIFKAGVFVGVLVVVVIVALVLWLIGKARK